MTREQTKGDSDNIIFTDMDMYSLYPIPKQREGTQGVDGKRWPVTYYIQYIIEQSEVIRERGNVRNTVM